MRNSSVIGRIAALAALVLIVFAVGVLLLTGSSSYSVKAIFTNASQVVSGDQVEVAGNVIGTISGVTVTPDGQAQLTLNINTSLYQPLHQGTTATIRDPGLSSISARYVQLDLGPATAPSIPSGGVIPPSQTTSEVDLDQLFNSLDAPTRRGLQNVFRGSASQYAGKGQQTQLALEYLNPAIATSSILFHELNRDTVKFTRFIVNSSNLVTDLADRQANLSGLVSHLSTTFSALASQQVALGQSIRGLPPFMRLTNTTFVNLRNTLGDLTNLINATKPSVNPRPGEPNGRLYALLQQLEPLAINAVPTVTDLSNVIARPGIPGRPCTIRTVSRLTEVSNVASCNNLIELNELAVPLARATVGGELGEPQVFADGKYRPGAFPVSIKALNGSDSELAVGRPYAPDLTGWFEGYSHPGVDDANGGAGRVALNVDLASLSSTGLNFCTVPIVSALGGTCSALNNLVTNPSGRLAFAKSVMTVGQGDRCPGSMERGPKDPGSSATDVESGFPCTRSQVPTGS